MGRRLRETQRSAMVGLAGGVVFAGPGRKIKSAGRWGVAGAALGGGVDIVQGRRQTRDTTLVHVEKRAQPGDQLYRREGRVSPWRATEALAGVTLLATGGSRLKMVGAGLRAGRKLPGNRGLLFERGQSINNAVQRGTSRVTPTMRRVPEVSGAIDLVPRRARAGTATLVGMGMISNARPVRRDKYVPVNRRY